MGHRNREKQKEKCLKSLVPAVTKKQLSLGTCPHIPCQLLPMKRKKKKKKGPDSSNIMHWPIATWVSSCSLSLCSHQKATATSWARDLEHAGCSLWIQPPHHPIISQKKDLEKNKINRHLEKDYWNTRLYYCYKTAQVEALKLRFSCMQLWLICLTIVSQAFVSLYLRDYKFMGRALLKEIGKTGRGLVFTKLRSSFVSENLTLGQFKPRSSFCQSHKVQQQLGQLEKSQWLEI